MVDRLVIKQSMVDLRHALYGVCYCDLCRNKQGFEMHEIITRKATQNSQRLRELSFAAPICAILCSDCHDRLANTPEGVERLLRHNIELYTYEVVRKALYAIPEAFWPLTVAKAWRVIDGD